MKRKIFYSTVALAVSLTLILASASVAMACEGDDKRHKMVIIECLEYDESGNPIVIGYSNVCEVGNFECVYNPCPNE